MIRGRSNSGWSLRTVSAFGKFFAECYLTFGTSFKRILRNNEFSLGSRQNWDCVENDEKVIIRTPTKERL